VRFEGMQRKEELEVPIEALREILYNSITHKDYTGPDIQMHVYNDHVEIWNEGELPDGYDEEVLYGKHSSKPRNRNIADTMFKAGFIDTWGRGYKKIHDGFEKVGLPMPTVKSHCGGTLVTFQRGFNVVSGRKNVVSDVGSSVGSLSIVQLSERQKKICELITENPFISTQQMSVVLSVVKRTVERDLSAMQKKGVLIREGNTSAGHWIVMI
jgi:ATP-dependent DNA helicase RecG